MKCYLRKTLTAVSFIAPLVALSMLSSCTMEYMMKSPMFMGDDPVKDAKEKADHIAEVVKHLHEPMHTGFFGGEAETRREDAAWDLGHDLEATSAIPDLVQALNDESSNVRANAAASLWNFANDPKLVEVSRVALQDPTVAAGLRMRFSDSYLRVRLNAVRALAAMSAPQKLDADSIAAWRAANVQLLHVLYDVQQGPDLDDAMKAADLATTLGAKPRDVVPTLMRGIDARNAAKILLANLVGQPSDIAYLPVLLVGAKSNWENVRGHSMNLLGAGTYRSPQVQALLADAAISDGSVYVRVNAIQSMVVGGDKGVVGTVLGDSVGPENPVIALLLHLMRDPEPDVRAMATTTLAYTNSTAPEVIAAYSEGLTDGDSKTRHAAVNAVSRLGADGTAAVPALRAVWAANRQGTKLKDRDDEADTEFIWEVYYGLAQLGQKPPDPAPPLVPPQ